MIEELKNEIIDLERLLETKRENLQKLINDEMFSGNKLIAIVEIHDQFSGIDDIKLINDNKETIKEFEDIYNKNFMYSYAISFFRINEINQLKEDFEYLKKMKELGGMCEDSIYEWMENNQSKLIKG